MALRLITNPEIEKQPGGHMAHAAVSGIAPGLCRTAQSGKFSPPKEHTARCYVPLSEAYQGLNARLFDDTLPPCLITLQRKRGMTSALARDRLEDVTTTECVDEISIHPNMLQGDDVRILSILAHEMVHVWQSHFGTPSRPGYHNREWASKMLEIGLIPSDTGQPGGRQTGQRMDQIVARGGPFEHASTHLIESGFRIPLKDRSPLPDSRAAGRAASKTRYCCPKCGQIARSNVGANIWCGFCKGELMVP